MASLAPVPSLMSSPPHWNYDEGVKVLAYVKKVNAVGLGLFQNFPQGIQNAFSVITKPVTWVKNILGDFLRKRMYLPLHYPIPAMIRNMQAAKQLYGLVTGKETDQSCFSGIAARVREHFDIKEMSIDIPLNEIIYSFKITVVESKKEGVRFFLFSYYGHEIVDREQNRKPWKPGSIDELGVAPCLVLKALEKQGFKMDSLDLFSMGSLGFQGLKYFEDIKLPPTIILDRNLASTYRVATKLYAFPIKWILYVGALLSGWDANPESSLLKYFETHEAHQGQRVVVIKATEDFYFSKQGDFSPNFISKLRQWVSERQGRVFSGEFFPLMTHERAHHAFPREGLFKNGLNSGVNKTIPAEPSLANGLNFGTDTRDFFPMGQNESVLDVLNKNVLSQKQGSHHNCMVWGGSLQTPDILFMGLLPTLIEYIKKS